jgi:hypothetical protein
VTDGPPRAGSKFRAKWQGSPVTIVEYLSYERPKAWSATAPSKSLTVDFYATVTPSETGSRLDVAMAVIPHGPLRLLLPADTSADAAARVGQHALHQSEVGSRQVTTADMR